MGYPTLHARCDCCGLFARMDGDPAHPGHGVIETLEYVREADGFHPPSHMIRGVQFVHRCCRDALTSVDEGEATGYGLVLLRALLGMATESYEAGVVDGGGSDRAFLGRLAITATATPRERKHTRVRVMRYASLAAHQYALQVSRITADRYADRYCESSSRLL